ncbi:hypothetical protein NE236_06755 [Actinoallomurus purpureus]|nr:hypothetical protein [Actinoallomurus purpureus]
MNAETCIDVDGDGAHLTGEMSGYLLLCNVKSGTKCNSRNRTRSAPAKVVIGVFVNWNGGGTKHECDITKAVRAQITRHRDYVEYHCKLTLKPVKKRRYWGHGHIGHDVAGDGKGSYWIFTGQTAYYTPRP